MLALIYYTTLRQNIYQYANNETTTFKTCTLGKIYFFKSV